jgi:hypothetical protein
MAYIVDESEKGIARILKIPDPASIQDLQGRISAGKDRSGLWGPEDDHIVELGGLEKEYLIYKEIFPHIVSDDPGLRMPAIRRLGEINSARSADALIYVADGNPRTFTARTMRTFWLRLAKDDYDFDDQLAAIETLGRTGGEKACRYIKSLVECTLSPSYTMPQFWDDSDGSPPPKIFEDTRVDFNNGHLDLQLALRNTIYEDSSGIVKDGSAYLPGNKAGRIVKEAYDRILQREKAASAA